MLGLVTTMTVTAEARQNITAGGSGSNVGPIAGGSGVHRDEDSREGVVASAITMERLSK
jgi:hypothetical protein